MNYQYWKKWIITGRIDTSEKDEKKNVFKIDDIKFYWFLKTSIFHVFSCILFGICFIKTDDVLFKKFQFFENFTIINELLFYIWHWFLWISIDNNWFDFDFMQTARYLFKFKPLFIWINILSMLNTLQNFDCIKYWKMRWLNAIDEQRSNKFVYNFGLMII